MGEKLGRTAVGQDKKIIAFTVPLYYSQESSGEGRGCFNVMIRQALKDYFTDFNKKI